jgi:hypothetical protein
MVESVSHCCSHYRCVFASPAGPFHSHPALACLLFAVGSRHIEHPDVYWHAGDEAAGRAAMADMEMYRHSAGWRWMEAVVKTGKSFLKPATLEDLQIVTVSIFSRTSWRCQFHADAPFML